MLDGHRFNTSQLRRLRLQQPAAAHGFGRAALRPSVRNRGRPFLPPLHSRGVPPAPHARHGPGKRVQGVRSAAATQRHEQAIRVLRG